MSLDSFSHLISIHLVYLLGSTEGSLVVLLLWSLLIQSGVARIWTVHHDVGQSFLSTRHALRIYELIHVVHLECWLVLGSLLCHSLVVLLLLIELVWVPCHSHIVCLVHHLYLLDWLLHIRLLPAWDSILDVDIGLLHGETLVGRVVDALGDAVAGWCARYLLLLLLLLLVPLLFLLHFNLLQVLVLRISHGLRASSWVVLAHYESALGVNLSSSILTVRIAILRILGA